MDRSSRPTSSGLGWVSAVVDNTGVQYWKIEKGNGEYGTNQRDFLWRASSPRAYTRYTYVTRCPGYAPKDPYALDQNIALFIPSVYSEV